MNFPQTIRQLFVLSAVILFPVRILPQTQEDFNTKLSEVYTNVADKKKALSLAKNLYDMVEKKKDLQTYSNYYLLKTIFENQAPDAALAKTCADKATRAMNAMVGLPQTTGDTAGNPMNQWYYVLYPGLFSNKDPQNAIKALAFLEKNPSFKTYDNYYFIAYAFEREGDFPAARQYYETAMAMEPKEDNGFHSHLYYANFLSRTGDYLRAEDYIRKMEQASLSGPEIFRNSYKSEAMSAKVVYYLNIGDFQSYIKAADENVTYSSELWHKTNTTLCDPYPGIRFTNEAFAKEMMRQYDEAEKLWKSRDSVNYIWVNCYNQTYPNSHYYPISMYPVYLIKRGKFSSLPKPASFFIKETEDHYNSYSQYADISINFMKATQLGFLGSSRYPDLFRSIMQEVKNTRNFRESTQPFSTYAYLGMRDRHFDESAKTYTELFGLNAGWINDIIFTFGEKAFATYYNSRLKEGYDNFHSFVKIAKEKQPALFPQLSRQAYSNLLFTKSISLKGTERRKEAFRDANDPNTLKLYNQWIEKKQQLIRQYLKTDDPSAMDSTNKMNQALLDKLQDEVNTLENELTLKAKGFKKYLSITAPDWTTVRDRLKDGEAAIEMIRFQWRDQVYYSDTAYYAAYIITKGSQNPDVIYLPDAASDLDNKYYKAYKAAIRSKIEDKESYNHFWKPVAMALKGIKKVYFSPDGIYHLINLATLKDPGTGQFLLDEMELHYTTSGTDIAGTGEKNIGNAVLFGRPSYRIEGPLPTSSAENKTRSYVMSFKNENIPDLPGTEEEVLSIKKEMDQHKLPSIDYLKADATEDKFYKLHSPAILHIATHGYWSPAGDNATEGYRVFNAMANSGLLLSGVVNYYSSGQFPDTYDGILTAYEAQNLDLANTSLVILSACETSLGYLDAGEGVYGLQRAFRAAGAKNIMTSLWKVDDNATRDFMIAFYDKYLETKDQAAAFLFAQKTIKEKYIHPYYWGAFVMTGE